MQKLTRTSGFLALALALAGLLGSGCASDSGSKEFIPGKGWKSTQSLRRANPGGPSVASITATATAQDAGPAQMVPPGRAGNFVAR